MAIYSPPDGAINVSQGTALGINIGAQVHSDLSLSSISTSPYGQLTESKDGWWYRATNGTPENWPPGTVVIVDATVKPQTGAVASHHWTFTIGDGSSGDPVPAVTVWDGATEVPATVTVWNGATGIPAAQVEVAP